jgi:hypothetical protein
MVDAFHQAALAQGGMSNGAPGERPYHPGYCATFVLDPDGSNIEKRGRRRIPVLRHQRESAANAAREMGPRRRSQQPRRLRSGGTLCEVSTVNDETIAPPRVVSRV